MYHFAPEVDKARAYDVLHSARMELIRQVVELWPVANGGESIYVNEFSLQFAPSIKYLESNGVISCYESRAHELNPHHIEDLPTDDIARILDVLRETYQDHSF